jgi:hypothetical protein
MLSVVKGRKDAMFAVSLKACYEAARRKDSDRRTTCSERQFSWKNRKMARSGPYP